MVEVIKDGKLESRAYVSLRFGLMSLEVVDEMEKIYGRSPYAHKGSEDVVVREEARRMSFGGDVFNGVTSVVAWLREFVVKHPVVSMPLRLHR